MRIPFYPSRIADYCQINHCYRTRGSHREVQTQSHPSCGIFLLRLGVLKRSYRPCPPSQPYDHEINLDDTFTPKIGKVYPLSPDERKATEDFLDENLASGKIRPSNSPQASPFFFVKKKDGGLRLCQDYRYVNEHTIRDAYPLPLISDLVDKLRDAKVFTKFDVRWGYNNV